MPNAAKTIKLGALVQSFVLNRASLNKEKRTVTVQFASEAPVKRWFGTEILQCDAASCDLGRMQSGAAVLMEHDTDQRIGITESATMTVSRTGEAVVRFARTPQGDSAMAEVEDGTLKWISVGYRVNKFEVDDAETEYRAINWEPLEVSFVAIPADPSAKVLRSGRNNEEHEVTMFTRNAGGTTNQPPATPPAAIPPMTNPPAAPNVVTQPDFSRELEEVREIGALTIHWQRSHPEVIEIAEKAIRDKVPLMKFQRNLLEVVSKPGRQDISAPGIGEGGAQPNRGPQSIGHRFITSEAYKRAMQANSPQARRGISVQLSDEFQFRADHNILTRATFSATTEGIGGATAGAAGTSMAQQILPGIPGILGLQPLTVADLFAQGATNGDSVRYIKEATYTQAATRVAEGGNKPEATLDLDIVVDVVEKTAVFLNVTDEMLSDFAQMSSFINGRLGYMVQSLEDVQLISGSGTNQIRGILNRTGIQTISGAANTVDQFLRAIEYVRGANGVGFGQPDAVVINPLDWLKVRLTKDTNGQYLFGGPGYAPYGTGGFSNVSFMWGVPVVATTAIAQGTALAGAFRTAAQIFRRMGLTIESTNSHASNFIANIITIRAEQRMALAVYQPNKFCAITAIPA